MGGAITVPAPPPNPGGGGGGSGGSGGTGGTGGIRPGQNQPNAQPSGAVATPSDNPSAQAVANPSDNASASPGASSSPVLATEPPAKSSGSTSSPVFQVVAGVLIVLVAGGLVFWYMRFGPGAKPSG